MWSARILGVSMALLATAAVAAPGDALVVASDVVNVRAGPGTRNPVLFHAYRHQQAVELERADDWVRVRIPGQVGDGWIHDSLLQVVRRASPETPAAPEPAPGIGSETTESLGDAQTTPSNPTSAAALPISEGEALARFRSNVDELNARAQALAGVELFTGAEPAGSGTVQVLVTDAWDLVPAAGQESYTNALFDRWRAAAGGSEPLRLQVVDPNGTVVSEKSGPPAQ